MYGYRRAGGHKWGGEGMVSTAQKVRERPHVTPQERTSGFEMKQGEAGKSISSPKAHEGNSGKYRSPCCPLEPSSYQKRYQFVF